MIAALDDSHTRSIHLAFCFGAANPAYGRYNTYRSPAENINVLKLFCDVSCCITINRTKPRCLVLQLPGTRFFFFCRAGEQKKT